VAGVTVRPGNEADLQAVKRIQDSSPGAAVWNPAEYLAYDFLVAVNEHRITGFVVARQIADGESEILNLAVDPNCRRRGVGRTLIDKIRVKHPGDVFLEVRESNSGARTFYKTLGFQEVSKRVGYYNTPPESGIVMKFHSC
jgi:ribosomal-protein-alanine acetyltransferase